MTSHRSLLLLWIPILLLVGLSLVVVASGVSQSNISIAPIGDPIDVWSSVETLHKCGILDVPDIPVRLFWQENHHHQQVHAIEGSTTSYEMLGPSVLNLTRSCHSILWNKTGSPDPSFFAANEFLDSTVAFSNGSVVALVHTEYPGDRYDNCGISFRNHQQEPLLRHYNYSYPKCWTVFIGLAVSHDFGTTWRHALPPPNHLVFAVPYRYDPNRLAYGWGDPSNIVRNPNDQYYYVALWNRHEIGQQPAGICIARTQNLFDPTSWRGWAGDEKGFVTTFVSPYRNNETETDDVEKHICVTVDNLPSLCAVLGLVWSAYLKEFVATLGCFGELSKSFYFATSTDLIHWTTPVAFYSRENLPEEVQKLVTGMAYPSLVDPKAPSSYGDINYSTIGQEPYLYWTSLGHSTHTDGRHLWATPVRFTKENESMKNDEPTYIAQ